MPDVANVRAYQAPAHLFLGADIPPAASPTLTLDADGVPAGAQVRYLGATQGAATVRLQAQTQGVDVEQVFGAVTHYVTAEQASLQVTLLEQDVRNLALALGPVTRPNFLPNSSFERASAADATLADGYSYIGGATGSLVADPHPADGARAQEVVAPAANAGLASPALWELAFVAGAAVNASLYVKGQGGTPQVRLILEALSATSTVLGSAQQNLTTTASYQRLAVGLALPANTVGVRWRLVVLDASGGTVRLDNAQVALVASASAAPPPYAPSGSLFLGGRQEVPTTSVVLVARKPGTTPPKFHGAMLYRAYVSSGLELALGRSQVRTLQVTFTALPLADRPAGDQYAQLFEQV
jgi:hypothetical protein